MLIMVKFRSRTRVKKVRFLLKNNTFHLSRTLFWESPNYVNNFPHFINITLSTKKRQGPNHVNIKTFLFLAFRLITTLQKEGP